MSLVDRIFERFVVLYGVQKFRAMFEHDDNANMPARQSWEAFVTSQKPEVVRKVMVTLPTLGREWPPNLSEFMGMCREFDRIEQREIKALPEPKLQTEKGKMALDMIKRMIESKRMT